MKKKIIISGYLGLLPTSRAQNFFFLEARKTQHRSEPEMRSEGLLRKSSDICRYVNQYSTGVLSSLSFPGRSVKSVFTFRSRPMLRTIQSNPIQANQLISFQLTSYLLIPCHLFSSHAVSSHLISALLISSHLVKSQLMSCHLISSHFISCHLILSHLISRFQKSFRLNMLNI